MLGIFARGCPFDGMDRMIFEAYEESQFLFSVFILKMQNEKFLFRE